MKEARRRSHTKWDCKYHMVFISEVGGIQCGGIHQGEECNLDCPGTFWD